MVESGLTKTAIDSYLDRGLDGDLSESFQSADELWALLENLDFGFGDCGWFRVDLAIGPLYTRDLLQCIQLLLGHLPFADHIAFEPVQFHDTQNRRIYSEMYSGDWWWEAQGHIADGGTLIPLICASDKTRLTNFSGNKSAWPLYITLGNISKEIRRQKSKRGWVLVALLPVPPKNPESGAIHASWHEAIDEVLKDIKNLDL